MQSRAARSGEIIGRTGKAFHAKAQSCSRRRENKPVVVCESLRLGARLFIISQRGWRQAETNGRLRLQTAIPELDMVTFSLSRAA
jgi:hypothetical protein